MSCRNSPTTTTQPTRGMTRAGPLAAPRAGNSAWTVSLVAQEEEGRRMTLTIPEEMGRSSGVCVHDVCLCMQCVMV